jgi:hypothetical protein
MFQFIRKAHRWVAPIFVLAVIAVVITGPPVPSTPAQIAQQLLMLLLTISGVILFVYPFIAKAKRNK